MCRVPFPEGWKSCCHVCRGRTPVTAGNLTSADVYSSVFMYVELNAFLKYFALVFSAGSLQHWLYQSGLEESREGYQQS